MKAHSAFDKCILGRMRIILITKEVTAIILKPSNERKSVFQESGMYVYSIKPVILLTSALHSME